MPAGVVSDHRVATDQPSARLPPLPGSPPIERRFATRFRITQPNATRQQPAGTQHSNAAQGARVPAQRSTSPRAGSQPCRRRRGQPQRRLHSSAAAATRSGVQRDVRRVNMSGAQTGATGLGDLGVDYAWLQVRAGGWPAALLRRPPARRCSRACAVRTVGRGHGGDSLPSHAVRPRAPAPLRPQEQLAELSKQLANVGVDEFEDEVRRCAPIAAGGARSAAAAHARCTCCRCSRPLHVLPLLAAAACAAAARPSRMRAATLH